MAIVTTILIVCQNIIGAGLATAFDLNSLMGLATGSIPMVGGHGTAAAFGPLLESIGLDSGVTIPSPQHAWSPSPAASSAARLGKH